MMRAAGWAVVACAAIGAACAAGRFAPGDGSTPPRALWVWSTDRILGSPDAQRALFDFSDRQRIGVLSMQVTTGRVVGSDARTLRLEVTRGDQWRSFLAAAHGRGLQVEALDGDPTYADAAFHYVPLAITDAVVTFNRDSLPRERFDGLRFDNEPYLLPGWSEPQSRAVLLRDHLSLNEELQRRVDAARPLTFGIDLPVWWDLDAAARLFARLDTVTLMDYRNEASGPDGLVALATPALTAAARANHATVRVGVETRRFEDTRVWFVVGPPVATARETLGRPWRLGYPGEPFRLRSVEDNGRLHLGVTYHDEGAAGPPPAELIAIARDYGSLEGASNPAPSLAGHVEWCTVERHSILDSQRNTRYAGFIATNVAQPKLTFATRPDAFTVETSEAERAFREFPQYRGLAVHDYEGFQALGTRH